MINQNDKLPKVKQCQALGIARSAIYYKPKPVGEVDLMLMHLIDKINLHKPFLGIRRIRDALQDVGHTVNPKRVQRFMREMGIQAIYPKASLSKANQCHRVYPYLLRKLNINRANQVWCSDVTYIPMHKGFVFRSFLHKCRSNQESLSSSFTENQDTAENKAKACSEEEWILKVTFSMMILLSL